MFQLSLLKDTVSVHPSNFGAPADDAIISEINKKYANRVLHDVGLCICVFDLVQCGEGKVRYGDGLLWYKVVFRLVVFRPFTSEVIIAKVKSADEDSIRLTLGFFDDIYIPASYLPQPSAFDPQERAHFWLPPQADPDLDPDQSNPPTELSIHDLLDTPVSTRMYIDQGEVLRVRVESEEFYDDEPGPEIIKEGVRVDPRDLNGTSGANGTGGSAKRRAPFNLVCSIAEQGLGPVAWWNGEAEEEDAMQED